MKPFYCRQGSKRRYTSGLLQLIPEHKTYVEAFIGGGAVFWAKEPSEKEVLNDLDSQLIQDYHNLQNASTDVSKYPVIPGLRKKDAFLKKTGKTREERITEALFRRCNGYMGSYIEENKVYKPSTQERKFEHIAEYKARLKDVNILNEDYRKVLKKYDSNSTFFFLDPPYEKSIGLDYAPGSEDFDYDEMVRVLKRLRGKFLVTINDSPYIRQVFSDFHIYPYNVSKVNYGRSARDELLITNYILPRSWKNELVGAGTPQEDENAVEEQARLLMQQLREQLQIPGHMFGDVLRRYATERRDNEDFDYNTPPFLASSEGDFARTPESTISPVAGTPPVQTRQTTPREYVYEPPQDAYGTPPRQIVQRGQNVEPPTPRLMGRGVSDYLKQARAKARKFGYDPSALTLAEDGVHKLCIEHDGKKICFGRAGYGDFLIWTRLEREGMAPKGTAQQKRRVFRKSHSAMKGDWKSNPYSKNNLALNILW